MSPAALPSPVWHPCTQMQDHADLPPLHVVGAHGCRLRLADGREILDAIGSWWCKSLGHGHPRLVAAAQAQIAAFEHVILAGVIHDPALHLAQRLLDLVNGPLPPARRFGHVFYADNGSTGVEVALKMAVHWQRQAGDPRRTRFACLAEAPKCAETSRQLAICAVF